jgi:creatinine amidohydrolase
MIYAMQLALSTWPEVEAYLGRSRGIILPIGSTEQHGPSGLIGTDALVPEAAARAIGERCGALVGPAIAFGVSQFNLGFAGTMSVRAATLMALVEDCVRSLARHGFDRFYFLNGHGGNIAPLKAAFHDLYAASSLAQPPTQSFRLRLRSWWEYPRADRLRKSLYGEAEGMHATPSEVAITQYLQPQAIRRPAMSAAQPLSAEFLREHAGDDHADARSHRAKFPDGRVGSDPARANPEDGQRLFEAAVEDGVADYLAFLAES